MKRNMFLSAVLCVAAWLWFLTSPTFITYLRNARPIAQEKLRINGKAQENEGVLQSGFADMAL